MKLLAISGSARAASTNTALLRRLAEISPANTTIDVIDNLHDLPVFSPDLEGHKTPANVSDFINRITRADGIIISSPEYVRAIPGGLKNAIDWLVSGQAIIDKPVALIHASHRGDEMLASLRLVLGTVTAAFQPDVFLRFSLISRTPDQIRSFLMADENTALMHDFLAGFTARIGTTQLKTGADVIGNPPKKGFG